MPPALLILLLAAMTVGCVATRTELQVLEGKLAYLESRVEKNEDLLAEISGSAQKEVLASRRETTQKLEETRKQTAELLQKLQTLEAQTRALQGEFTQHEARLREIEKTTNAAVARAEAATQTSTNVAKTSAPPTWNNENEVYEAARKAYTSGDLTLAAKLYDEQLQRWPNGKLAGNAQFWLGEIAYSQKNYLAAVERYLNVIERHKGNAKTASAYYKMALALEKLGEKEQALRTLQDLLRLFPKSEHATAAETASKRLQK